MFTFQEYETDLIFTFIRAGKVCSGKPNNAEASGLSSLDWEALISSWCFIVPGRAQSEGCVLPLGTGWVKPACGQMDQVLQVDSSALSY